MITILLLVCLLSLIVMVGCFRLGEAYPWLLETKAKDWLMATAVASSALSAISLLLFLAISIRDKF